MIEKHPDGCTCDACFDRLTIGALAKMNPAYTSRIIEVTPELERRILQERRREPREKIADLERRLASIAEVCETCGPEADLVTLEQIYRLAKGTHV